MKGDGAAVEALARAAAQTGKLSEDGWSAALFALQQSGRFKAGLELAEPALREHPGSALLLNTRGVARQLSGGFASRPMALENSMMSAFVASASNRGMNIPSSWRAMTPAM